MGVDTVNLTVKLLLLPKVTQVVIKGNNYSTTDFLLQKLTLYNLLMQYNLDVSEQRKDLNSLVLLDYEVMAKDKNVLYNYYLEKGFNDVKVTHKIEKSLSDNSVKVIYNIDEGKHSKTDEIVFHGNKFFTNKQLVRTMEGRPSMWRHLFGAGYLNEEILQQDYQTIERVYIGEGFLDFEIKEVKKTYFDNDEYVKLDIYVDEGVRYKIGKVSLAGNKAVATEELEKLIKIKTGDFYRRNDVNKTIFLLREPYRGKGYADIKILKKEQEKDGIVDIVFQIKEGEITRINDINIVGNKITRDFVIRRELTLHPGDMGDASKIAVSQRRLQGLGFFESVTILPIKSEVEGKSDLIVKVKERPTGSISLGVGASDQDQVSANFSLSESNFSLYKPYRGDGQRFVFSATASSQRSNYNILFSEPWLFNERISYTFNAYRNERLFRRYDRTKIGVTNALRSQVPGTQSWQQILRYRFEEVLIDDIHITASPEIVREKGSDYISALSLTYRRQTIDRGNRPTRGSIFSLSAEWQAKLLGSSNDVYTLSATYKTFWQPTQSTILRLRTNFKTVDSYNDGRVAIYNRYTEGGLTTIRGYNFRDVSPVDINNDPIGGNSSFTGSLELEFPLVNRQAIAVKGDIAPVDKAWIRGVLFTDFGNVWEDSFDWQFDNINVTIGVGFRIDIPGFGTMVLDFARPTENKLNHTRGGEVHFNFGYNF